ncbi:hypothetical protein GCM10008967_23820 [Bacillus carboniphilus]|uniref:Uncharacterized protein n=1 Tax=Bacillus carboniphilus TaxID=86663 RepID=A0ABN0WC40_9BACI
MIVKVSIVSPPLAMNLFSNFHTCRHVHFQILLHFSLLGSKKVNKQSPFNYPYNHACDVYENVEKYTYLL